MLSKEGWVCKTGVCVTAVWNMKRKESVVRWTRLFWRDRCEMGINTVKDITFFWLRLLWANSLTSSICVFIGTYRVMLGRHKALLATFGLLPWPLQMTEEKNQKTQGWLRITRIAECMYVYGQLSIEPMTMLSDSWKDFAVESALFHVLNQWRWFSKNGLIKFWITERWSCLVEFFIQYG